MTQIYSAASIYGIIDRMDDSDIQSWLNFHKRLKYPPRFINIFTAARFNDAPNVLRKVRDQLPDTIPVWRGYDGRDAWGKATNPEWTDANYYINLWNHSAMSPAMAAGMWFARRVKPYLDVIRETGSIIHLLNEAAPLFNAPFETECIRILGEEGIRAGAFAWTAGAPDWADYQQQAIEDEIRMAAKYKALVMVHEYAGFKPEEQNSLINRNQNLVTKFDQLKLTIPDVFLGEFALAKAAINPHTGKIDLDPDGGWRDIPVTDVQYMDFIKGAAKVWYLPKKVSFSIYSWPDWGRNGSFGVSKSQDLLDSLITASEWMSFSVEDVNSMIPPPQPSPIATGEGAITMQRPPEAQRGFRVRVKSIPVDFRNLRKSWEYTAPITGQLKPDDVVRRFDIPLHTGKINEFSSGNWIFVEKLSDATPDASVVESGYVYNNRITWEPLGISTGEVPVVVAPAPEPTPAPVVEPPPPAAPAIRSKRYSLVIDATDERHDQIEKTLMALLTSVVYLGQFMGGLQVTIDSHPV
jgi:hypothetical protein